MSESGETVARLTRDGIKERSVPDALAQIYRDSFSDIIKPRKHNS